VSRLVARARAENLKYDTGSVNEIRSALRANTMNEKRRVVAMGKASATDERVERGMCSPTKGGQANSGHIVRTHPEGLESKSNGNK
jgi:hypothetical protein